MNVDIKIIATICGVLFTAIIVQFVYNSRVAKKKIDDRTDEQINRIFEEMEKISNNYIGLHDTMIKGFSEIKVYIVENFTKKTDCQQVIMENRENHNKIWEKLNDR